MKYLILISLAILFACGTSDRSKNNYSSEKEEIEKVAIDPKVEQVNLPQYNSVNDKFDTSKISVLNIKEYLTVCDKLEVRFGAIQNDKAIKYIYPFGSCNSNEQFEMIWVPKGKRYTNTNSDSLSTKFKKEKEIGYPSFNVAVFELPKTPVEELEEEFDMGLSFPCEAKIFVRVDGAWHSYEKKTLKDFEEFTEMQVEVVNKINNL